MKKLMVIVAALAMITGSAYAADWDFYGSARISTFWTSTDQNGVVADSVDDYGQALQSNARIGAKVKVSDELTGRFEYGASSGNANIRLLYGEWDFGGGKFLVGQDYAPLNWFYSNQVFDGDSDLLAMGGVYSGRVGQLKLKFGGFQAALVPASTSTLNAVTSTEVTFPGIELAYSMKMDNFGIKLGAGWQQFDATNGGVEDDVTSYVLGLGADAKFGAFYLGGNIYVGQNAGNMIAINTDGLNTWDQGVADVTAAGVVVDNDALGAIIVAGFTVNDMFTFEAGYGYVETEFDDARAKDKCQSYYLNSTITMAPGVFVVPEIGVLDGDENGDYENTYFGAKWQINF